MNDFDEQLRKLIHMERHNFAGSSSRAINDFRAERDLDVILTLLDKSLLGR